MQKPKIFLSYCRDENFSVAVRIFDELVHCYGIESVFVHYYEFPRGHNFRQYIDQEISECDILLVVLGSKRLSIIQNRSKDPKDYFMVEIEAALRSDIPIIPILLGSEISMPSQNDLPESIKEFADKNEITVAPGNDFKIHIERLKKAVDDQFLEQIELKKNSRTLVYNGDFVAPWLLGSWDNGKKVISKLGFAKVKIDFPESGNEYEYDVEIKGDIIEFYGRFEGELSLMKWRKISDTRCHYYYHEFNNEEHEASHIFDKDQEQI